MKPGASCLRTILMFVLILVLIRFALPAVWGVLAALFMGGIYIAIAVTLVILAVIGLFTYKNLSKNAKKEQVKKYERVTRVEDLYKSVVDRLNQNMILNEVSAEELLQSEVLIHENLANIRAEIIHLKDFASPENQKNVSSQVREYQQQLRETKDVSAKEVVQQNLKMIEQKKNRIEAALDEIRQKEGMVDLVYNSLANVEEDLKFGRSVQRLFPPELYQRFGLTPPSEQSKLPPLMERSNE